MNLTSDAGVGVRATDGKLMWRYEKAANGTANCTTPVYHEGKVFYTSAYGTGGGLLALTPANGEIKAQEMYFSRDMQNHHGGVVLYNGHLYGSSNAILTCLEWITGKPKWRDRAVGKGSLTLADGSLYLLGEDNTVAGRSNAGRIPREGPLHYRRPGPAFMGQSLWCVAAGCTFAIRIT